MAEFAWERCAHGRSCRAIFRREKKRRKVGEASFPGGVGGDTLCASSVLFCPCVFALCPVPAVTFLEWCVRVCPPSMDPKLPIPGWREGSGFLCVPAEGDHTVGCHQALGAVGRELTRPSGVTIVCSKGES